MTRLFIVLLFILLSAGPGAAGPIDELGKFFRELKGDRVIVFVHGIRPNNQLHAPDKTWVSDDPKTFIDGVPAKNSVMDAVVADRVFDDADVFEVEFNASLNGGSKSIPAIADDLFDQLEARKVLDFPHILFVAHSLGGLVVRKMLLNHEDAFERGKVRGMLLLSTPMDGAEIANLGGIVSNSTALFQMETGHDRNVFLDDLRERWMNSPLRINSRCVYETTGQELFSWGFIRVLTGLIVGKHSASELCTDGIRSLDFAHTEMTKIHSEDGADILDLLRSYYQQLFTDTEVAFTDGQFIAAKCEASDFADAAFPAIEDVLKAAGEKVGPSKWLPNDWLPDRDAARFVGPNPKAIVIHFSCFEEEPEELDGSIEEASRDLSAFLVDLPESVKKIIVYSRAIKASKDDQKAFYAANFSEQAKARYKHGENLVLVPVSRGKAVANLEAALPDIL